VVLKWKNFSFTRASEGRGRQGVSTEFLEAWERLTHLFFFDWLHRVVHSLPSSFTPPFQPLEAAAGLYGFGLSHSLPMRGCHYKASGEERKSR